MEFCWTEIQSSTAITGKQLIMLDFFLIFQRASNEFEELELVV